MKKLLLSSALLGALAFPVLAQDQTIFREAPQDLEIRASDFMGMRLYATEADVSGNEVQGVQQDWNDIGEVNDIIFDRDGQVQAVLVDIGGFLGIGERTVAVSMDALHFVSDSATADNANDYFLVINANRDALENAPQYGTQQGDMTAEQAATETEQAIDQGAATTAAAAGAAAGATVQATENAGDQVANAADNAAEATGEAVDNAGEAVANAANDATDQTTTVTTTDGTATTEQTAQAGDTTANQDVTSTEQTSATTPARTPVTREGYVAAGAEDFTAERLQGAAVYGANDERVGEVGEIVMNADGQVQDLVIDVGGFLGIGEKPVALPMNSVDILKQEGGDEIRVYVSQTKDELEQMPRYEAQQ